ncbi:beta-1,6-N-acetylglucosaminyltransferase [Enterococcus avium]|uniref:beta-1,6-N-acetylglucosaminyltransferase n=1 Tax=Enterococcus avium TaxID=33945 RepID=UPI001C110F28|nr:beta-1,6-N-acetylglucosaminyltransferase [Enterococcus avium]MBU5367918.1 beta-1,6-N-acetylglucosaminyltransferase [Enterococcus avium]MDO7799607.1 beta-1,6-N-acetylglucosaminyltransferase [Enterococcus avium]
MDRYAILILAHSDFENLERLVSNFDDRFFDIFIHIDKKTDSSELSFIKNSTILSNKANIHFIENNIKVFWGGYSIVKAEIKLLSTALSNDKNYSHYIMISGSDYLIKSSKQLRDFLAANREDDFVKAIDLQNLSSDNKLREYVSYIYKYDYPFFVNTSSFLFRSVRKLSNLILNRFRVRSLLFKDGFHIYQGSQWWVLTEKSANKILNDYYNNQKAYDKLFSKIFAPDEKFFHSIYYNLSDCNKNSEAPITFIEESDYTKQTASLANITLLDDSLQKWFTKVDFDKVIKSNFFFVRKVNSKKSAELLDMIDQHIKEKNCE